MSRSASSAYPRDVAVRVLTRVLSEGQPLDEALAAVSGEVSSSARGWLQEVCSGTLRWKGRLDQALDAIALKKKPTGWLRKILLIGAYQLIVQERTQPAAVVSETVSEIKRKEGEAPARFANACLRKIADHAVEWRDLKFKPSFSAGEAAKWASLPEWLWVKLVQDHGLEWASAFASATLERPVLWLRSAEKSWQATEAGAVRDMPGFSEGQFIVQDISSQVLVSEISAEVREAVAEIRKAIARQQLTATLSAVDLCAAPGGKSVGLAWNGFHVVATDRDEKRLSLLRQTIERVKFGPGPGSGKIEIRPRERIWDTDRPDEVRPDLVWPDLIWIDAPCSGTGIIRRHPDVRWLRKEGELAGLCKLQQQLLREAWERVPEGRFLAYSVCSVLNEEGPGAIEQAELAGHIVREWRLEPQSTPYGDGFWAALLRK